MSIRVVVHGAAGKMGRMVISAIESAPELVLAGGVDVKVTDNFINTKSGRVPFSTDLDGILKETAPGVLVDFSTAKAVL